MHSKKIKVFEMSKIERWIWQMKCHFFGTWLPSPDNLPLPWVFTLVMGVNSFTLVSDIRNLNLNLLLRNSAVVFEEVQKLIDDNFSAEKMARNDEIKS